MVETNDRWIVERTGIRERHIADPGVATSDMAIAAAQCALTTGGTDPSEVNAIIVCTVTPDMLFPSTACLVQNGTAAHLVGAGTHKKVLVIGSDTMSRIIDYTDRATCILFGDAAGAMLVEAVGEDEEGVGFIDFRGEIDGSGGDYLKMPAGGSRMPASHETVDQRMHFVHQEGQQVFKYAVRKTYEACSELLARNGLSAADVAMLIPHQANARIITASAERLGIPLERVLINIDRYGNTTAATIPLATRDALQQGCLRKGDLVVFAAVGAGYTVGASLWRWAY
jgi:3-oxoacyl-[acyl-carrier-protein] synthase-3